MPRLRAGVDLALRRRQDSGDIPAKSEVTGVPERPPGLTPQVRLGVLGGLSTAQQVPACGGSPHGSCHPQYASAVATSLVGAELATDFGRDGVVCVRQVLDPGELASAARAIEIVLANPSPISQVASSADDPGSFFEDFCRWREIPEIEQLARGSRVPQIAAALMSTPQLRFYHDHVLVKEGGTQQRTPWHQDQPYYNIEGRQNVSFWIPVDPVSRASTLELVAGSHRGPWLMPRSFMDKQAKWFPEGALADLPDVDAARERYRIVGWPFEPGDVVCFHMLTLHAAAGVDGPHRRRVFSARFLGDDIVHAPRAWQTSPDFAELEATLPAGAPLEHPLFPLLWSA